jgi:glycosyltransferase involved in cell wall biosynthesis
MDLPKYALVMMLKNEKKRLSVTLESARGLVNDLIVLDTGSTDNTIDILKEFAERENIKLHLKCGEFVNFEVSRNELLDFADTVDGVDVFLCLDCNDEIRCDKAQLDMAMTKYTDVTAFHVAQEWWSGQSTCYFTNRIVRPRTGWRYKGVVHEYLFNTLNESEKIVRLEKAVFCLYQDRTADDDKSNNRFPRDAELLLAEHARDPSNTRTVFYLAQTYECMRQAADAYKYFEVRSAMDGFIEEKFIATHKLGVLAHDLKYSWDIQLAHYMRAFQIRKRVEPLVKLADHYRIESDYLTSFMFAKMACDLEYPRNDILFVNKVDYEYTRWHIMAVVAYYCDQFELGASACKMAIENGKQFSVNTKIDESNLKYYVQKLDGKQMNPAAEVSTVATSPEQEGGLETELKPKVETKKEFCARTAIELRVKFPNMTAKQVESRCNLLWKSNRKRT